MSMKDRLANKAAQLGALQQRERPPREEGIRGPKTAPGQLMASIPYLAEKEEEIAALQAKLQEAERNSSSLEIAVDQLHEVAGRRRNLSQEQFEELRDNLRNNALVTPITVRMREGGGYEVISGHNRLRAYRDLGRATIPAVVRPAGDVEADINAFYANLFQPTLPDYEKYLGFKLIQGKRPELTQDEIASMAGVSQSLLSRLMSFETLPTDAHEILANHPDALGASAASALAKLTKAGKGQRVADAIRKIVTDGMEQNAAVTFASDAESGGAVAGQADGKGKAARPKPAVEILPIKVGKTTLCTYRKTETTLRVDFKDAEHADAFHEELRLLLDKYASSIEKK